MRIPFCLVLVMAFAAAATTFGQGTDADSPPAADPVPVEQLPEDIPPPEPVPYQPSTPAPQMTNRSIGEAFRADAFGVSLIVVENGLQVRGVVIGSVAQASGVKPNDTIVSVNGNPVGDGQALQSGNVTSVDVVRQGRAYNLPVVARPTSTQRPTYSVPRTVVSTPRSYSYAPSYRYAPPPAYTYRSVPYSYRAYRRPGVSVGIGYGAGYPGFSRYGYGPGFGYGPYSRGGFGPMYYGRGRSGVGISIGGIGIRF